MQRGINIAGYLARLEDLISLATLEGSIRLDIFFDKVIPLAKELGSELKEEISHKETLSTINGQVPLLESYSFECQIWALSILFSAWSQWVFTAKSNDPVYRMQNKEAADNALTASSYVRKTVMLAMEAGAEIGSSSENNYRPEKISKFVQVEK